MEFEDFFVGEIFSVEDWSRLLTHEANLHRKRLTVPIACVLYEKEIENT